LRRDRFDERTTGGDQARALCENDDAERSDDSKADALSSSSTSDFVDQDELGLLLHREGDRFGFTRVEVPAKERG
jgi:hypothetical protein